MNVAVHQELAELGFSDETLVGALGAIGASLDHDGVRHDKNMYLLLNSSPPQIHKDALAATFETRLVDARRGIDSTFLARLCEQLGPRGVQNNDVMRIPQLLDDPLTSHPALIDLVREDLRKMERQ